MRLSHITSLTIVCLLCACSHLDGTRVYNVDIEHNCDIGDILSGEPEIIHLGSENDIFITYANKTIVGTDNIYVLDRERHTISLFDRSSGEAIFQLNKKGRGPGEYIDIADFDVYENNLYVLSRGSKKMLVFSDTGKLLSEFHLDKWYSFIKVIDECTLWVAVSCRTDRNHDIGVLNTASGLITHLYNNVKESSSVSVGGHWFFGDCLYVSEIFDPTVYKLDKKGLKSVFRFNLNIPGGISRKELNKIPLNRISEEYRKKDHLKYLGGLMCKDSTFFTYACYTSTKYKLPLQAYSLIKLDLKDGSVKQFRSIQVEKSPSEYPLLNAGSIVGVTESALIKVVSAKDYLSRCETLGLTPPFQIEQGDNPVLFLYHLNLED